MTMIKLGNVISTIFHIEQNTLPSLQGFQFTIHFITIPSLTKKGKEKQRDKKKSENRNRTKKILYTHIISLAFWHVNGITSIYNNVQ